MLKITSSPFGSGTRTRILLALRILATSYPREIARLLNVQISAVRKALISLEADGLVTARSVGRTRQYQLNPGFIARDELRSMLAKLADADAELRARTAALRRRPRKTGKPL